MDTQVTKRIIPLLLLTMPISIGQVTPAVVEVKKEPEFVADSSRKMLGDTKAEWVVSMSKKLPIASRAVGPFGMSQNPNVTIATKPKVKMKPGAFLNAIKAMKISTVMASEHKFAIGAREFRKGDSFPVIRGPRQFNIEIISVRSDHIIFKNVDSNEYVRRNLNALPAGVSPSSTIESVPGVIPAGKKDNSPLRLDSETIPTSN